MHSDLYANWLTQDISGRDFSYMITLIEIWTKDQSRDYDS